jgi:protein-disulfide isomerase
MSKTASLTPPVSERDHSQGTTDALLTLVEFGDYQCPYCGAAYPVVKQLQETFGRNLRFVFRNFPMTQAHPYALIAAEAAEAAALQDKFWEMHDLLYENQQFLEDDVLQSLAKSVELDLEKVRKDITKGNVAQRIKEDRRSGIASGVNGTPSFFINGIRYDGNPDYGSMRAAIEEYPINQTLRAPKRKA